MITRKFLLSALTLLAIIFTPGCKDEDSEFVSMNVTSKDISVGEEYQFFVTVQSSSNSVYSGSVKWSIEAWTNAGSAASSKSPDQIAEIIAQDANLATVKGLSEGQVKVKAVLDDGRYAIASLYVGKRSVPSSGAVYIARNQVYLNQSTTDTLNIWISDQYSDANLFPVSAQLNKLNADGSIVERDENNPQTIPSATFALYTYKDYMEGISNSLTQDASEGEGDSEAGGDEGSDSGDEGNLPPGFESGSVYVLVLNSSDVNEDLACTVSVGDYDEQVEIHVSFSLYLSFNPIDPTKPYDNPESTKPLSVDVNSSASLTYYFYVEDGTTPEQSFQKVKEAFMDKSNYTVTGTAGIVLGNPVITPDTYRPGEAYSVNVSVTAGNVAGTGVLKISAFGKELSANVTVDDGMTYSAIYISFTEPNTYTIPPTEMSLNTSVTADMSVEGQTPNTFKIRVYHYVDPDKSAPYIQWNVSQSGDPVIIPVGRECDPKNNKYTDFTYQVGTSSGSANVTFNVYNPQGELGVVGEGEEAVDYGQYLNQSITATVTVQDKSSITVNSVTFNPDDVVTNAAALPLEAVIDPATAVSAWPIEYEVTSLQNGAKADIISSYNDETKTTVYQLKIEQAGIIQVTASAGSGSNKKSDVLTVTAKLSLDKEAAMPLQIMTAPQSMKVGETATITKLLRANYSVDESMYTWVSSEPDVVSVDAYGNVTALSEGTSKVRVEIKDDYNLYASDERTISVVALNINANFDELAPDYMVVYESGNSEFWIDTPDGANDYYTFVLDNIVLESDGVYTAGVDFNGTITFPASSDNTECEIVGGTISVAGDLVTFDLTVSYGSSTGKVTGTRSKFQL